MERYLAAVSSYLEDHPGVQRVSLLEVQGCSVSELEEWEHAHTPYRLPGDLKSFLQVTDGLSLTWDVDFKGERVEELGQINVNPLRKLLQIPLADVYPPDDRDKSVTSLFRTDGTGGPMSQHKAPVAFDLDCCCTYGRVALVFESASTPPCVYFQDLSCMWNLIARNFGEYFRLLMMHLGLPHWQYAFTPHGLDAASRQWFNFLSPERLAIDLEAATMRKTKQRRAPSRRKKQKGGGGKAAEKGVGREDDGVKGRQRAQSARSSRPKTAPFR